MILRPREWLRIPFPSLLTPRVYSSTILNFISTARSSVSRLRPIRSRLKRVIIVAVITPHKRIRGLFYFITIVFPCAVERVLLRTVWQIASDLWQTTPLSFEYTHTTFRSKRYNGLRTKFHVTSEHVRLLMTFVFITDDKLSLIEKCI